MFLQQQQQLFLQHQAAARDHLHRQQQQQQPQPQPHPKRGEPETITVSDDEDEAAATKSKAQSSTDAQTSVPKESLFQPQAQAEKTRPKTPEKKFSETTESSRERTTERLRELSGPKEKSTDLTASSDPGIKPEPLNLTQEKEEKREEEEANKECQKSSSLLEEVKTERMSIESPPRQSESPVADLKVEETTLAETLVSFSREEFLLPKPEPMEEEEEEAFESGFDLLLRGMEMTKDEGNPWPTALCGIELFCSITRVDHANFGLHMKGFDWSKLDVGLLCAITEQEHLDNLNWVDPMVILKRRHNLHQYRSPKSEEACKSFITNKIRAFNRLKIEGNGGTPEFDYWGIKSLAEVVKKIRNTEIMSQLEVELRENIAQLQELYKEKQKMLSRLKTPKKKGSGSGTRKQRGPGRPKKRRFKSSAKTKMGRPRKNKLPSIEEEVEYENDEEDLSPPVLEPCGPSTTTTLASSFVKANKAETPEAFRSAGKVSSTGALLKPPKLTASLSPPSSTKTDLSTISAKFMKGKSNPFANLMKLATPQGQPEEGDEDDAESKGEEDEEDEEESTSGEDEIDSQQSNSPAETSSALSKKDSDPEDGSSAKKRKSDKPRKHTGVAGSETIVPKKPRNLFMMNCLNLQRGFKSTSAAAAAAAASAATASSSTCDEYEFHDEDEDAADSAVSAVGGGRGSNRGRMFTEYREPHHASPSPLMFGTGKKEKEQPRSSWRVRDINLRSEGGNVQHLQYFHPFRRTLPLCRHLEKEGSSRDITRLPLQRRRRPQQQSPRSLLRSPVKTSPPLAQRPTKVICHILPALSDPFIPNCTTSHFQAISHEPPTY